MARRTAEAYKKAWALDDALLTLDTKYYSQSRGGKARSIRERIWPLFADHARPGYILIPSREDQEMMIRADWYQYGRDYYLQKLRPLITNGQFIKDVRQTVVRRSAENMDWPDTCRTEALAVLEAAPAYWDAFYAITIEDLA